jgi:predicted PurR-regulated permease PerM
MKRAVGIPPLAVLISVYVGQTVAGISGVVLAVPFVATVIIVIQELWKYQESEKSAHHSTQIKTPLGF